MDFNLLWEEDATNKKTWFKFAKISQNQEVKYDNDLIYMINILKSRRRGSVLDVGCGVGLYTHFWIENNFYYLGIDQIPFAIEVAKRSNYRGEFIAGDFLDLDLKGKFDVIFTHTVLQHVHKNNKNKFMNQIHEILGHHGYFLTYEEIIEGTDPSTLNLVGIGEDEEKRSSRHPYLFTRKIWIKYIEKFGFKYIAHQGNYILFVKL